MTDAAAFRGQPLLVFGAVLCAWLGLRVALWQPASDIAFLKRPDLSAPGAGSRASLSPIAKGRAAAWADAGWSADASADLARPAATTILSTPIVPQLPGAVSRPLVPLAPAGARADPVRIAVGHSLLLVVGLSRMELLRPLGAYLPGAASSRPGIPAAAPLFALPSSSSDPAGPRLSADAWLMLRNDTTSPVVSGRPSYGRGQAGGMVRYRLVRSTAQGPQAYLRASSALQGAPERHFAAGMSARPVPRVPLRFAVEARVTETGEAAELQPAVMAVTEVPPVALARGVTAEAYVQGGYVGGRFATGFVDGQGRIERTVARHGETGFAAGAGVWGGAQDGAARLDVGPTAVLAFRLGEARGRVAADYRFRVAGSAEPRSGPALTLSAGF